MDLPMLQGECLGSPGSLALVHQGSSDWGSRGSLGGTTISGAWWACPKGDTSIRWPILMNTKGLGFSPKSRHVQTKQEQQAHKLSASRIAPSDIASPFWPSRMSSDVTRCRAPLGLCSSMLGPWQKPCLWRNALGFDLDRDHGSRHPLCSKGFSLHFIGKAVYLLEGRLKSQTTLLLNLIVNGLLCIDAPVGRWEKKKLQYSVSDLTHLLLPIICSSPKTLPRSNNMQSPSHRKKQESHRLH